MKLSLLCAVFAALVGITCCAGLPAEERDRPSLVESVKSYLTEKGFVSLRDTSHKISKRQASTCVNQTQCLPPGITDVPEDLINCIGGRCDCNECFERNDEGTCSEVSCDDWRYDEDDFDCEDNRPKQLTALLLSIFLSSTGAANFYIGRDDLGAGQISLLIIMLIASYAMCYVPCCLGCCMAKDDMKGSIFFVIFMLLMVVIIILIALAVWAWWLADLIIFATNQRDAGNGCMLQEI